MSLKYKDEDGTWRKVPTGTHSSLEGRDESNQHPASSISYSDADGTTTDVQSAIDATRVTLSNITTITSATTIIPADNTLYKINPCSAALTISCNSVNMLYGAHFMIALGDGGSVSVVGYERIVGDYNDILEAVSGDYLEISVLDKNVVCKVW